MQLKDLPFVSVIIPNYNHAAYLDQRISSILRQTYQNFEILILDDKSIDNSKEIIEKYRSNTKITQILYNEINSGSTFKQWKKGIEASAGDYIWIAESDDWCEPYFLETLMDGIRSNDNCVLAYCQSYVVTNSLDIIWQSQHRKLSECINGLSYIKEFMLEHNSLYNASMAIFKKNIYPYFSTEYTKFRFSGDWLFWIEAARQGDVFVSGKLLNFFRKHDRDVSGKAYSSGYNFKEEIAILQYLFRNNIIDEVQFNITIVKEYRKFVLTKQNLKIETIEEIEQLFYDVPTLSKSFYKRNEIMVRLKNRITRYVRNILD